jgi:hypothetical protein
MMFTIGAAQCGSGLLLCFGVACTMPLVQVAALVIGLLAAAVQVGVGIADACKDAMKRTFSQIIKQIRETKSSWDNKPIVETLGLGSLLTDLEGLVTSC